MHTGSHFCEKSKLWKHLTDLSMLIETYTSKWIADFNSIKREIENGLEGSGYVIEHVGSTAVPGLASKPIIDIDLIYTHPDDFLKIKRGLEKTGYFYNGNQGIEGREVFKRNGKLTHVVLDTIKHHLYVCPVGSKALERHLLSRDYLRKNEWARLKYQQMKYDLAKKAGQDKRIYQELKELNVNEFIDLMIRKEKLESSHFQDPGGI